VKHRLLQNSMIGFIVKELIGVDDGCDILLLVGKPYSLVEVKLTLGGLRP